MRFLVDAQLPRRLVKQFQQAGIETIHTLDLPLGNRTPDTTINELSVNEHYVVVTKDLDFVDSFHLYKKPWKLLLVATGNISNADLEALFIANINKIVEGFATSDFIEINRTNVIFHL
jgi:predicted nuclease of predicted toxin-antitoxin system